MSLVIFSNSEYSYLWPIIEESVSKIKIHKIFVSDFNEIEKPKNFQQYIQYNSNNCYSKRWTHDILPKIESEYILIVHDVSIIVNMNEEFILKNIKLMCENSIDRCSLNVFSGNQQIENYGIKLCNLNNASGNTITPYDVCSAIWRKKSLKTLFEIFPEETYASSELNHNLQNFCRNNFKCYGQQKTNEKIFYCLGRPYLNEFKILHITIKKEILNPIEVYMDMKDDFLYYSNKYNLNNFININDNFKSILDNFRPI